jgi:hypothetical protein
MTKFDVVIGNPPYMRNLHLKFLDIAIDISKEYVCFIEPANWLFNEKEKNYNNIEKKVREKLNNLNLNIETQNGTYLFNAKIWGPVGISFINKLGVKGIIVDDKINNFNYKIDNLDEISKYGISPEFISLKNKILTAARNKNIDDSCFEYDELSKRKKYFINISAVGGNRSVEKNKLFKDDFYKLILKNDRVETEVTKKLFITFEIKTDAEYCISYLKSSFARFAYSIYKNTQHVNRGELKSIPYLDFTQEWTDEKLYKHFQLTEDEIAFIEKHIPKYYD